MRSSYVVTVHADTKGNMIIIPPTLVPMMKTSDYEPKFERKVDL